jgi:ATP-dependent RNA helicase RhlB
MEFRSLELPDAVMRGIEAVGFTTCTPIQEMTLPHALAGRDIAGQAQTGTGKTAAFLIATFVRLLANPTPGKGPRALMIAPTRELAVQIFHDAEALGQFTGLTVRAVYGGVDYAKQRDTLREGCDILVGTPGRLIDYFKQRVYDLKSAEVLVIDEADRMFDMGFIVDLRFLLRRLPRYDKRQSMLFSATLNLAVMELAYEHMNDPVQVAIEPERLTAENIEHVLYHVSKEEKFPLLLGLMRRDPPERAMVFVNTKREADWLTQRLQANGVDAQALTGDVDQRVRLRILKEFKAGDLKVLVATDVASRGLHIEAVSHVYNYDVPQDPEDYVHRIGRTARAGASGKAITLGCDTWAVGLETIEKLIGFRLPVEHVQDDMLAEYVEPQRRHRPRSSANGRPARGGAGSGRERPRPGAPGNGGGGKRRRRSPPQGAKRSAPAE